jgi:GT2 family glycosyltransferase
MVIRRCGPSLRARHCGTGRQEGDVLAVITTVAGRHDHLLGQERGLRASDRRPDRRVVVQMDDPEVAELCGEEAVVVDQPRVDGRLPVAAARNRGAEEAVAAGADVLVFLDVDCIPAPTLLDRYVNAAQTRPRALLSGAVGYLAPPGPDGYRLADLAELGRAHPGRPTVPDGRTQPLGHDLFWSLSFALTASCWAEIGGFCEAYAGYGGEDTDFAQLARKHGIGHYAIGGAWAYHQWHPAPDPPLQHLHDVVRNARIFHRRWGWWPMTGWLEAFQRLGLISYDPAVDDWTANEPITAPGVSTGTPPCYGRSSRPGVNRRSPAPVVRPA